MGGPRRQRQRRPRNAGSALGALTLATPSIAENTAAGTMISGILGKTGGSTLSLIDSAGGHFALSGLNLVAGPVATDYEAASGHAVTLRETLAGAANSPRDSVLTLAVTDLADTTLAGHLAMGTSWTWGAGTPASGYAGAWHVANPSIPFNKIANPGWKVADLQGQVANAAALLPQSISIEAGINDLGTIAEGPFMTSLQALVSGLKTAIPGVKVFVGTVVPSTSGNINPRRPSRTR